MTLASITTAPLAALASRTLLALTLVTGAVVAGPSVASACGGYGEVSEEERAFRAVARHYGLLNQGERALLLSQWVERAPVVSRAAPDAVAQHDHIENASRRWVRRGKVQFQVQDVVVDGTRARATVMVKSARGVTEERLTLVSAGRGWRLAAAEVTRRS